MGIKEPFAERIQDEGCSRCKSQICCWHTFQLLQHHSRWQKTCQELQILNGKQKGVRRVSTRDHHMENQLHSIFFLVRLTVNVGKGAKFLISVNNIYYCPCNKYWSETRGRLFVSKMFFQTILYILSLLCPYSKYWSINSCPFKPVHNFYVNKSFFSPKFSVRQFFIVFCVAIVLVVYMKNIRRKGSQVLLKF